MLISLSPLFHEMLISLSFPFYEMLIPSFSVTEITGGEAKASLYYRKKER